MRVLAEPALHPCAASLRSFVKLRWIRRTMGAPESGSAGQSAGFACACPVPAKQARGRAHPVVRTSPARGSSPRVESKFPKLPASKQTRNAIIVRSTISDSELKSHSEFEEKNEGSAKPTPRFLSFKPRGVFFLWQRKKKGRNTTTHINREMMRGSG